METPHNELPQAQQVEAPVTENAPEATIAEPTPASEQQAAAQGDDSQ